MKAKGFKFRMCDMPNCEHQAVTKEQNSFYCHVHMSHRLKDDIYIKKGA